VRESWNSVSSWNSSEEDDSIGVSNKKIINNPVKTNVLNQIDEETSKLNETGLSRNSTKNEVPFFLIKFCPTPTNNIRLHLKNFNHF
jgi:hypothetical protein